MRFSADTYSVDYLTKIPKAVSTKTVITAGTLDDVYSVMVSNQNQCIQEKDLIEVE